MKLVNWLFESNAGLIVKWCWWWALRARDQQTFYAEGLAYLTRHYFTKRSSLSEGDDGRKLFGVYLHRFHRGDLDRSLHNHPWRWSFSIILTNGYVEERWNPKTKRVDKHVLRPGSINVIRANDFHRVDLLNPDQDAWTLFFAGKRLSGLWGFWRPGVHGFIPHTEFVRHRDHG